MQNINNNQVKALVLAGGMGKRLWPVSRKKWPKYLMEFGGRNLLQHAYSLVNTADENKYIIGAADAGFLIKKSILEINNRFDESNMLLEPLSRNTAPAVALGIRGLENDDIAVVLPADHIIEPRDGFNLMIENASALAREGYIVTAGIKARRPSTAYGYIRKGGALDRGWKVDEFREKPDEKKALEYVESGEYFWNAGIFVFRVSVMKEELEKHFPEVTALFNGLNGDGSNLKEIYEGLPDISIDYAVMEKTDRAAVVGFEGKWNDVGSWEAAKEEVSGEGRNYCSSEAEFLDCRNTFVSLKEGKFFAGAGLNDLIIVDTGDALLALREGYGQRVRDIVEKIEGKDIVECRKTDYRPWGGYRVLEEGEGYKVKVLFIRPGHRLSLQKHRHRDETWTVLKGRGLITAGEEKKEIRQGETSRIPAGTLHRAENTSDRELEILELATGNKISEDDIIRIEDDYNRL